MEAEQGTLLWLQQRCGRATASNFDKVMAGKTTAARQGYITQLALERIFGTPTETFKNKAMERGNELEPIARLRYMLATRNTVTESPFVPHETLEAGASPDGLIGDDGLVEIKCPLAHNHFTALKHNKVPTQYIWQVVGQQLMTGRTWTDFVSFSDEFPKNAMLAIVRVDRDEAMIEKLEAGLKQFLEEVEEAVTFIESYNYGKGGVTSSLAVKTEESKQVKPTKQDTESHFIESSELKEVKKEPRTPRKKASAHTATLPLKLENEAVKVLSGKNG